MTKARTLADFISDGSEFADGTISVAEVSGAAPLASPSFTGNVGIGVTPATFYGRALHVHDTGTAGANIRLTDSNSGTTGNDGMDIIQINNTSYIINREAGGMNFYTGGQLRYTIQGDGTHVFNENSLDSDFRIESDDDANMFFLDGNNNKIGIRYDSPSSTLHIRPSGEASLTVGSSNAGGALLVLDGDANGDASGGDYAYLKHTTSGNLIIENLAPSGTEIVVNETGVNMDFRVESDNESNMLFVDAGNNRLGIRTNSPASTFHIDSDNASGATYGIVQNDGTANTNTIAGWVIRDGTTVMSGVRRRRDGSGSPVEIGNFNNDETVDLVQNNERRITLNTSSHVIVNEPGLASDFRVESDSNTHMLFVDGANNRIGINASSPQKTLEVVGDIQLDATNASLFLKSGATGTSGFVNWTFNTDDSVFAKAGIDYDSRSTVGFHLDSGYPISLDASMTSSRGLDILNGGSLIHRINTVESAFNENSLNHDFRVESDSNTHMLFVDAGQNVVKIGTSNDPTSGTFPEPLLYLKQTTATNAFDGIQIEDDGTTAVHGLGFTTAGDFAIASSYRSGTGYRDTVFNYGTNSMLRIATGGTGETVVNDIGIDVDFRVESDNNANMFKVDAGEDKVLIGTSGVLAKFTSAPLQVGGFAIRTMGVSSSATDTGISVNAGSTGMGMLVFTSRNTSSGTATASSLYLLNFYHDGNHTPAVSHISGSNYLTFSKSGSNTLTIQNASGGNCTCTMMMSG